jgi:hypothetical protein
MAPKKSKLPKWADQVPLPTGTKDVEQRDTNVSIHSKEYEDESKSDVDWLKSKMSRTTVEEDEKDFYQEKDTEAEKMKEPEENNDEVKVTYFIAYDRKHED